MRWLPFEQTSAEALSGARWILVYATVEVALDEVLRALGERAPAGVPVFGTTSFQGVFTPQGFQRGAHLLVGEAQDAVTAAPLLIAAASPEALAERVREACAGWSRRPDTILMHATPGLEEAVLRGIAQAYGDAVPVYGGSAADDDLSGRWRVFSGRQALGEGVLLVGLSSAGALLGDFVGGYLATRHRATVTRAEGRRVYELDGQPAAEVYDGWTRGAIAAYRDGGVILGATTLSPLGRVVDRIMGIPIWLLSHPHQVADGGALDLFTEVAQGDELVLMRGSTQALVARTSQVVEAARRQSGGGAVRGGVLVYCGGCVGAVLDRTDEIARVMGEAIDGAPFIGVATFGEQGCFRGTTRQNRHGNLMSSVVLFGV